MFTLSISYNGMPCIELEAIHEQHWFLRRAILDSHCDSLFYKKKQKANPFIQSGGFNKQGYILVEFWGDKREVQLYVDWLNSQYDAEVEHSKRLGLLEYDRNSIF